MSHYLTARQPLFLLTTILGISAALLLPKSSQIIERAAAETTLAIGDQISSANDLSKIPDGQHQFCSEPEPAQYLGAGTCYWFNKMGNELVGYYGIPHSDIFIDCISGTIQKEKVIGNAIALSWPDAPLEKFKAGKSMTWKTLTLASGKIEYSSLAERNEISVIQFNQAVLSLENYYRYSPEKVALMNTPPVRCNVQEWVNQVAAI